MEEEVSKLRGEERRRIEEERRTRVVEWNMHVGTGPGGVGGGKERESGLGVAWKSLFAPETC